MIHRIGNLVPNVHDSAFIAPTAEVAGSVTLARDASVWPSASLRGDVGEILVGECSNVQDGAVLHCDRGIPTVIGREVTIGHGAIVHSADIGDRVLVGMGAIVLGGARIARDSIVGAGALVTGGKEFPPGTLILGSPAKAARELTEAEIASIAENAEEYRRLAREARDSWREEGRQ